jgi:uncharacterized membrane protein
MIGTKRRDALVGSAADSSALALELAGDRRFRRQLISALEHGAAARRRARPSVGALAVAGRLAADEEVRRELAAMARNSRNAYARARSMRRNRRRRTTLVLVAVGGAAAAVPGVRRRLTAVIGQLVGGQPSGVRVVQQSIVVEVPVSTAYNQWTQFEEFPHFMDGIEEVRQLDDTRLHWVASVAGTRAEWDARITEQHPDRQITWISEDGKTTRGTVGFEPLGPSRTRIELSMSYRVEGVREKVGSAAGLDERRVRGDLERFKELIEGRGAATGAWRGEVSEGVKG